MQFKQALKKAGLKNPGRRTWCGIATDGVPVFTIWSHEVHKTNGRLFAWWSHAGERGPDGELSPEQKGSARAFIARAAENIDKPCRAVIIHPRMTEKGKAGVESADYPHPSMARVVFRVADQDALQFIAELLPEE